MASNPDIPLECFQFFAITDLLECGPKASLISPKRDLAYFAAIHSRKP
jgi:hypothetical protein